MGDLMNCPRCDSLFIQTKFRDVCDSCYKEEEKLFDLVYQYIRKRENRTAAMQQVIEATGVEEELIIKFIRNGRLKLAQFPNLGYKCERCGGMIRDGRLCVSCSTTLKSELQLFKDEERRKQEIEERDKRLTYHVKENGHPNK